MYKDMEMWTEVRRSVSTEKLSKRQACKKYDIHWETLEKILANPEPPKERKKADREKPVIGPYLPIIHAILEPTGGVLMSDATRREVLAAYQKRKQETVIHPFLNEKITFGLVVHIQARLLARHLRGDLDAYPPFVWK